LSPAELARRFGVSVKALRLYERHGLLKPLRTSTGWRAFGPQDVERLHSILCLKGLGLSLARIGELFNGRRVDLEQLLALQERALAEHRRRLDRALTRLAATRRRLESGGALSIEDFIALAKETTVSDPTTLTTILDPLIDAHFTEEDRGRLAVRAGEFDQAAVTLAWQGLIEECRVLMARDEPASPEAMDLARRWMAQLEQFTGGDPGVLAKTAAVWRDAETNPEVAPALPLTPRMFAFIGRAQAARTALASHQTGH
jgi:DNA-binding transcriptional MerR regulator